MKRLLVFALMVLVTCAASVAALAQSREDQMAQINALIERSRLIPKIDQFVFAGRYREALPVAQRLVEVTKPALGAAPEDTAWSLERLARVYEGLGRWPEAERVTLEALRIRDGMAGAGDAKAAENRTQLAIYYEAQGRDADAERLYDLDRRGGRGAKAEVVATRLNYLSVVREAQGRYDEAELLAKRALAMRQALLAAGHPDIGLTLNNLAMVYWAQGRRREGELLLERAIAILEQARGREHPDAGRLIANLASMIEDPRRDGEGPSQAGDCYRREDLWARTSLHADTTQQPCLVLSAAWSPQGGGRGAVARGQRRRGQPRTLQGQRSRDLLPGPARVSCASTDAAGGHPHSAGPPW